MKRPFHPLLFAAYPVLALYSANQGLVPINQVFLPLVLVGGCVVTLWALGSLLFRNAARAALVASAAVTGFFLYGHLRTATNLQEQSALLLWFPLYALLIAASAWKWKDVDRLTPALNAVAILLFAFPLATIALGGAKSRAGVKQPFSAPLKQNRPDIIHIVLDGYGRSDSLRKVMRYDNSAFLEALRKRGFQVLPRARANYVQTEQSLSSALNLNYVQHLFPEAQPSSMDRALLDNAIDRSLVSMRLRAIGYTYVAITTGFPFISFRSADLVLGERSGNALFLSSLLNLTPLPESSWTSESQYEIKRKAVHSAFANIAELSAPSRTPKFIFAHILMPHPPFVFGP
ncbi:MAG TPA: hypothetical protein VK934_13455, partial [Fimbriimonas sp.]|nr:hypothetical protein [Fimbriimonas sp.]